MNSQRIVLFLSVVCVLSIGQSFCIAQPPAATEPPQTKEVQAGDVSPTGREARLAEYLTGAIFKGSFTMGDQADVNLKQESYKINSCELLDAPNTYRMKVKIKYGDVDGEFPMDLKILWSGVTPVITLDGVWIPGLGTFSARVLIHDNRYAGTWQHDDKGGHLFGSITR